MKKLILFITALTVSLNLSGRVFAEEVSSTLKDQAGITPDNAILYPIDKAIDNIKVNLSTEDNKADVLVEVAEERLGESEVMAEEGKTNLSTETLNEYNNKMNDAVDKVQESIDKTAGDVENTTEDSKESLEKLDKLKALEEKITERQKKSIEILQNIQSKLPEKAQETIAKVIEMQTAKKEAIIAVAKERQTLIQTKKAVKEAEQKLEQAKKAGDEQAIKTAEEALKQKQDILVTQKEAFKQVVTEKKAVMKVGVGELKKELKEQVKEGNITKEEAKKAVKAVENVKYKDKISSSKDPNVNNTEKQPVESEETLSTTSTTSTINNSTETSSSQTVVNKESSVEKENEVKEEKEDKDEDKEIKDSKEKIKEKVKENKEYNKKENKDEE